MVGYLPSFWVASPIDFIMVGSLCRSFNLKRSCAGIGLYWRGLSRCADPEDMGGGLRGWSGSALKGSMGGRGEPSDRRQGSDSYPSYSHPRCAPNRFCDAHRAGVPFVGSTSLAIQLLQPLSCALF